MPGHPGSRRLCSGDTFSGSVVLIKVLAAVRRGRIKTSSMDMKKRRVHCFAGLQGMRPRDR